MRIPRTLYVSAMAAAIAAMGTSAKVLAQSGNSSDQVSSYSYLASSSNRASLNQAPFSPISSNQSPTNSGPQDQGAPERGLVIEPKELPPTYPQGPYQVNFHARGNYVPVLRWRVQSGALPPGITLDDNGSLHGAAQRAGEFSFVVLVKDGGQPQQALQEAFVIKVVEAITVAWKVPPHVNSNRIEGSVQVSNSTVDDMDLTFDVKAVADNGRATEIGYQRFALKKGTLEMALPFGESLPYGGYVIYVNVVGEVPSRNAIYKEQMKSPAALQVVVGP